MIKKSDAKRRFIGRSEDIDVKRRAFPSVIRPQHGERQRAIDAEVEGVKRVQLAVLARSDYKRTIAPTSREVHP